MAGPSRGAAADPRLLTRMKGPKHRRRAPVRSAAADAPHRFNAQKHLAGMSYADGIAFTLARSA